MSDFLRIWCVVGFCPETDLAGLSLEFLFKNKNTEDQERQREQLIGQAGERECHDRKADSENREKGNDAGGTAVGKDAHDDG